MATRGWQLFALIFLSAILLVAIGVMAAILKMRLFVDLNPLLISLISVCSVLAVIFTTLIFFCSCIDEY